MFDSYYAGILLWALGDIAIWGGLYYLFACSHKRSAKPDMKRFRLSFFATFAAVHLFLIYFLAEFSKWGGPS